MNLKGKLRPHALAIEALDNTSPVFVLLGAVGSTQGYGCLQSEGGCVNLNPNGLCDQSCGPTGGCKAATCVNLAACDVSCEFNGCPAASCLNVGVCQQSCCQAGSLNVL